VPKAAFKIFLVASVFMPVAAYAQDSKPLPSVYISKEDIAKISATEQSQYTRDENARVIDLGPVNFELGIVHRASTHTPPPARPGGNAGAMAQRAPCGQQMASLPPDGQKGGLTHDYQSEGYYIVSGGGTMFLDGYIVNGRHSTANTPGGPNGPTCGGTAYDSHTVVVKPGDVIVVPPNAVHGWADIPDHVDYLTFRMSTKETMQAGWVNPTIAAK
jgi:mannose-6-phosphate isomerase-like protein (cupin superfamily)